MSGPSLLELLEARLREHFASHLGGAAPVFLPVEDEAAEDELPSFVSQQPDVGPRRLELPDGGWPIGDLAGLGEFVGLPGWGDVLPSRLLEFEGLRLVRLEIDDAGSEIVVEVRWKGGSFPVIPRLIEVREPGLLVGLDGLPRPESGVVTLVGLMELGGAELSVGLGLPGLTLSAELTKPCSLSGLLDSIGLDSDAFRKLQIETLVLGATPQEKRLSIALALEDVWEPGGGFALHHVELSAALAFGPTRSTSGRIMARGFLAGMDLELSGEHDGPGQGWRLAAMAAKDEPIQLGALLARLVKKAGGDAGSIPGPLRSLEVSNLGFTYETRSKNLTFDGEADLDVTSSTSLRLAAGAAITHQPDGSTEKHFEGKLTVADLEFDVVFDKDSDSTLLLALYKNVGGGEMHLRSLIAAVSEDAAGLFGEADPKFKLSDVLLVYEPGDKEESKPGKYLFALDLDFGVSLSGLGDLPLIGSLLPTDQALRLAFQPIVTSKDPEDRDEKTPSKELTDEDMDAIRALLPEGSPQLPDEIPPGFSLVTTIRVGDFTKVIELGGSDEDPKLAPKGAADLDQRLGSPWSPAESKPDPVATVDPAPDPNAALAAKPDEIQWVELAKHFGPLHIDRVGLGLVKAKGKQGGRIAARLDAALSIGPMTIALEGLGADYDLESKGLSFSLDGLGLEFEQQTLSFSGAFMRRGDAFVGKATLRMETLSLGAIGAYQEIDEHPSFFLYAFLDYPLGGPVFFFVEGLALGFGYNRRLIVPEIEELHAFPLIAEVTGDHTSPPAQKGTAEKKEAEPEPAEQIRAEMQSLQRYLPPQLDQYFLAVGVKFNSFKILDGFALLVISFGHHLEFDLIGQVTMQQPPPEPGASSQEKKGPLLAWVTMVFAARYVPDDGFLGVTAQIGPGSFVYTPDCHLQGGFAFSSWFKGEHAGDFVYSMGGYHPHFAVPAHYPAPAKVPRLGFQWNVDSHLTVKGGLYYALTSGAAMAGGYLEALWHSGALEAWFKLGLDLLIQWKPYHYEADAHVEIGARLTIDPPIIGSIRVTIEAGAELELWGPEFSGRAHVHVSVMGISVGFEVEFIETSEDGPPPLAWKAFAEAFLPKPEEVCSIAVTDGLLRTVKDADGGDRQIVNPKELCIATGALVPSSRIHKSGSEPIEQRERFPAAFGVAPMDVSSAGAVHWIRIERDGEEASGDFTCAPVGKRFPAALWGHSREPAKLLNAGSVLAMGGSELRPSVPRPPALSSRVEREKLDYLVTREFIAAETPPEIRKHDCFAGLPETLANREGRRGQLNNMLAETTSARAATLAALGLDVAAEVSLSDDLTDTFVVPGQLVC